MPSPRQIKSVENQLAHAEAALVRAHARVDALKRAHATTTTTLNQESDSLVSSERNWTQEACSMTNLTRRPVQQKAAFKAEQDALKAQRKADAGIRTKDRATSVAGKANYDDLLEVGRKAGVDEEWMAWFFNAKSKFPFNSVKKWFLEQMMAHVKADSAPQESSNDHSDYASAMEDLGGKLKSEWGDGYLSAIKAAKVYLKHPGNSGWAAARAIIAKLGTCAWLGHVAHVDGDAIQVLGINDGEVATEAWAQNVASSLSKITGRKLTGVPCPDKVVAYNKRTCK